MSLAWEVYIVLGLVILGFGLLIFMLVYRHRNKTNIETNLLLKQMRITNRMRGALDVQKDYLEQLDRYHILLGEDWEHIRAIAMTRAKLDIGDMREPPEPKADVGHMLANLERG